MESSLKKVNLYFCNNPISAHLAMAQADFVGRAEKHIFVSARNTALQRAFIRVDNDQVDTKKELMCYVDAISAVIAGAARESDELRIFIPHTANAIYRLAMCHPCVDHVYLLEEGSLYYVENLDARALKSIDYVKKLDLTYEDLLSIARNLELRSHEADFIRWALCGDFLWFDRFHGKISGALLSDEAALARLSYRKDLDTIIRPLSPLYYSGLETSAIYMPPPHGALVNVCGVSFEDVVRANREKIFAALERFERVVMKPHPVDLAVWDRMASFYAIDDRVVNYNHLNLRLPDGSPFQGELSVLNFGGFFVWNSSARMYVKRIWGDRYIADDRIGTHVEKKLDFFLNPLECIQTEDRRGTAPYGGRFMTAVGVGDAECATILKQAGLREPADLIQIPDPAAALMLQPAGFFQIENFSGGMENSAPNIPVILFIRDIRQCLANVLNDALLHDYGEQTSPLISALRDIADHPEQMLHFLSQIGVAFMQKTYSETAIKWLFRPGVLKIRLNDAALRYETHERQQILAQIVAHLNLPIESVMPIRGVESTAGKHVWERWWNDKVEYVFKELGGGRIQAFYDFDGTDSAQLAPYVGAWLMVDGSDMRISSHGTISSARGMTGRAFADRRGHLVLDWDTTDFVDYLIPLSEDRRKMLGWNNFAQSVHIGRP